MLFVSAVKFLLSLSLFLASSSASPLQVDDLDIDHELANLLEGRHSSSGIYVVKGINGTVYPRLEIRSMYNNNPDQWNLYLLALQQFKNTDQSKMLSFYQVAGIHGVPNVPWNGVQANPQSNGAIGYCTHDSVLFPAWHRPFIALYEQVMMHHVKTIVKGFPSASTRARYAAAAQSFRVPYWDWAAAPPAGPTFPLVLSSQYATVKGHKGQQTIPNPLYMYQFHPLNSGDMLYEPWSQWTTTMRWPTTNTTAATTQDDQAQAAIESARVSLSDELYQFFVNCGDYLEMSNDKASSSTPGCATSLEEIHNKIHGLVGGGNDGHMTYLWWSAFDPAFWLHHTNVDRLFAMWQGVYPSNYGAYQIAPGSTFTIAQGTTQGPNSALTPFHADSSGSFWTTNGVRDWTIFGYTYPEFADSDGSASSIRRYINNLYGPNATATAGSSKARRHLDLDLSPPLSKILLAKTTTDTGAKYEYNANVATSRFGLGGSYNVYLFMGGPSDEADPSQWFVDPNLIGSVNVFSQPYMRHNKVVTSGTVPLTRSLTSVLAANSIVLGQVLTSLEKSAVVPFLQKALVWRVATSTYEIIDPETVPGFEVSVVTSEAQPAASDDEFPTYSAFQILPDITHEKKGGLKIGQKSACEGLS